MAPGYPISDFRYKNSNKKEKGEKNKFVVLPFFCSHKYHRIKNYFIFDQVKKKLWANLQTIIELFTPKNVIKLSKIWVWDPGFRITLFRISGVKKALDPGFRIRNTAYYLIRHIFTICEYI